MTTAVYHLENRQIFSLTGSDRLTFLQGLITTDVKRISDGGALYTALLTPQGKYLFDFFLYARGDTVYLDCEQDRAGDLFRKLMMYKLRADVEITDEAGRLHVLSMESPLEASLACFPDPRLPALGFRAIVADLPDGCMTPGDTAYHQKRLALGVAEGAGDFIVDKSLALEGNMEELHGVDFNKGCYVGQEITARTKHRGKIRRRFVPVTVNGPLPDPDSPILNRQGQEIGVLRAGLDGRAMAYVKLEKLEFGETCVCGEAEVTPWKPDWMKVEDHVDAD